MDNNDFLKDKRKRITRTDKPERRTSHSEADDRKREQAPRKPFSGGNERRSFNPNFTPDNQLRDAKPHHDDKPHYGDRPKFGDKERPQYDRPRRDGERSHYSEKPRYGSDKPRFGDGEKPRYGNKPYSDRPRRDGDKPRFGDKPGSDKKPRYGSDKPHFGDGEKSRFGEKSYGDRPRRDGEKPRYSDKPYSDRQRHGGDNQRFGDKPRFKSNSDYNDRPRRDGEKPRFGDKPYSDRPRRDGDKPRFGEKSYGDRPSRDGEKPQGRPYNKKGPKPGYKKTRVHGENADGSYPTFAPAVPTDAVRLNRHIATSGRCSRRDADELIRNGRVMVNGVVVTEMGFKVAPGDTVELDGSHVGSEKKVYILMNKPKGFVTTLEDPHADKTVIDLLGSIVRERVYPVGRLDKNSLGVLLLTNDGDLTSHLTHPSHNKKKIYQATLDRAMTHGDMQAIAEGITLEDGPVSVDAIDYASENRKEIGIEIHSGRNRVVRRIFEHLGYKVTKLDRVYFAGLTKRNLKRGQWRFLTSTEVDVLLSGRYE